MFENEEIQTIQVFIIVIIIIIIFIENIIWFFCSKNVNKNKSPTKWGGVLKLLYRS